MVAVLCITIISIISMIICVMFFPILKIGKFQMQTFWFAPFLGAILILICGLIDPQFVFSSLIASSSVNPIQILIIFISMVFISVVLDEVGFFKYLASIAVKKANNNQMLLFVILYFVVSVLTIFTSNDIIVITFTPFIIFFCKNTKINPIPYLVTEFVAANTWSMLLIIGNPTNIYLATSYNINFSEYILHMFIPSIFAGATSLSIMLFLFKKHLKQHIDNHVEPTHILDKPIYIVSLILLGICIVLLSISSWIDIPMYLIALTCGGTLLTFIIIYCLINRKEMFILKESLLRLPYNLIPLLLSMFVIVLSLHVYKISEHIYDFLNTSQPILSFGLSSFLSANFINNIPMSVLFVDIISNFTTLASHEAIYASIIGSNIAAFFTPIGALAGMMWMGILKQNGVKFTFLKFTAYGAIISIPTLIASLSGLYIACIIF